jgi:hypothetical protein
LVSAVKAATRHKRRTNMCEELLFEVKLVGNVPLLLLAHAVTNIFPCVADTYRMLR